MGRTRQRKKKKRAKDHDRARAATDSTSKGAAKADNSFGWWVVAFLDLLGYKSLLARIDLEQFPTADVESAALNRGFLDVVWIRRRLLLGIDEFTQIGATFPGATRVLKSLGADHVVLAGSLAGADPMPMLRAIDTIFLQAAIAALLQLEYGADGETLPLRGGIDFGLGVIVPGDDFIVSAALGRAYELENTAKFPRILVGSRIHDILRSAEDFMARNPGHDVGARILHFSRSMMFKDADGLDVLDFFGERMRSVHEADLAQRRAERAWRYALAMESQFRADDKIGPKYRWLVDYMRPRLPLWGVSDEHIG